ncbi:uncharacterized protein BO80DRAFT_288322 [Aspergillus ibericus CBS 121593]|uniref:Uncharacterized protein n=1 Tax=Aspergillus ibericus CBS 121593 TaxID=1448316 RepID=A0A395H6R8_9EURO|nr:hypothetical protein BO80DRAFT_288322 [Aspergillus ibericus CBS 121593]RAL03607.1 hypothetical protein BO80DRAFT_288322 [Aspergillus ibericus CBS 121593]
MICLLFRRSRRSSSFRKRFPTEPSRVPYDWKPVLDWAGQMDAQCCDPFAVWNLIWRLGRDYWVDAELDAFDQSAKDPRSCISGSGLVSIQIDYCPEGRLADAVSGAQKLSESAVSTTYIQYGNMHQRGFTVIDAGPRGDGATVEWLPCPG